MLRCGNLVSEFNEKLFLDNKLKNLAEIIFKENFQPFVHNANNTDDDQCNKFVSIFETQTNQKDPPMPDSENDVWIFGYGSLMWKVDFPFIDRRRGYICGYHRKFYQHSVDHRGIPAKPGRVVTLLPGNDSNDRVYGVAYRIAAKQKDEVLRHLDYREKNGYERRTVKFYEYPETTQRTFDLIMYIATKENESYGGEIWQLEEIAEQIFTSAGPSGTNREYIFNLALAMRQLFPDVVDEHLCELETHVLKRIKEDESTLLENALKREIQRILEYRKLEGNFSDVVGDIEKLRIRCEHACWKEPLLTQELYLQKVKNV